MAGLIQTIGPSGKNIKFQNDSQFRAFEEGIQGIFRGWTGMQLAKHHAGGSKGDRVIQEMMLDIIDWFQKEGEIFPDEIEEYIAKEIDEGMGVGLEDGSIEEVSQVMNRMFRECCVGNFSTAESHANNADSAAAASHGQGNDDDDEQMEGDETAPALAPATLTQSEIQSSLDHIINLSTTPEQVSGFKKPNDVIMALYNAAKQHLESEGLLTAPAPKPKKKKSGRNVVSVDADGWSTVAK